MEDAHQILNERSDLLIAVFGKILLHKTFLNSTYFVTDGSFTTDGECKHNTSNDPFSRCKCAVNGYRKELTITTYSLTTSAQLD